MKKIILLAMLFATMTFGQSSFFLLFDDDREAPLAPQNLIVTGGEGIATLTWDVNTELDLAKYYVYKNNTEIYLIGNSIIENTVNSTTLQSLLGAGYLVINEGTGGNSTQDMITRFNADIVTPGDADYVVILGGINDINWGGLYADTIKAHLQYMYNAASAAGINVVAVTLTPYKNYSPYGSELITNGDFDPDESWVKGTGWTIAGGVATATNVTSGMLQQNSIVESGKTYLLEFDVNALNADHMSVSVGNSGNHCGEISSTGHKTFTKTSDGTNLFFIAWNGADLDAEIDNVSIKEIDSLWTVSRQATLDSVNTWILTQPTNVDYVVNAYDSLEIAGTDSLQVAYSGDGLHPNTTGHQKLATVIYNTVPFALSTNLIDSVNAGTETYVENPTLQGIYSYQLKAKDNVNNYSDYSSGANDTVYINLVAGGDFADSSGWSTVSSGWVIDGGIATYDGVDNFQGMSSNTFSTVVIGREVTLTFTISDAVGTTAKLFIGNNASADFFDGLSGANMYANGTYEFTGTVTAEATGIYVWAYNSDGGSTFSIDNIKLFRSE